MQLDVAEVALALLGVAALALAALWIFRLVQYRRAVKRSQARWLSYEPAQIYVDEEMGLDWPSIKPILLSPIPEERLESGRVRSAAALAGNGVVRVRETHVVWFWGGWQQESESDSMLSVRKDPMRLSAISVVACTCRTG
ncbi:hypothetical protein BBJ28_00007784 [Nothophytophthora sp. Chile5]|nr:hypothetical protein BBJ28_00007784 [Nothophytophthora sp. Chile5]